MKSLEVWTLCINHRYGEDLTVHATRESADKGLVNYVLNNWGREMPKGIPIPEDKDEMVSDYFEHVEREGAQIQPTTLEGITLLDEALGVAQVLRDQLEQMRGMFGDNDETTVDACKDHDDLLAKVNATA